MTVESAPPAYKPFALPPGTVLSPRQAYTQQKALHSGMSVFEQLSNWIGSPNPSSPSTTVRSPPAVHVDCTPRSAKRAGGAGAGGGHAQAATRAPLSPAIEELSPQRALQVLQNELRIKDAVIESLTTRVAMLEDENAMNVSTGGGGGGGGKKAKSRAAPVVRESCGGGVIAHRSNSIPTMSTVIDDKGRHSAKMGTRESLGTSKILEAIPEAVKTREQLIAEKFVGVFQQPLDHIAYLQSAQFANELIEVCEAVEAVLEEEPRVIFMQSPVYVIGDIHGNLEDLHFFADNIWKLGMDLTAGKFLFLGDYVDRGMSSLECVAYLFALKLLHPRKIYLLRGNHETRDVNGWEEHYHEKSFIFQCKDRFGASMGEKVWEECNQTFDRLPLAAVIDHDIFCIHGGIPRPVKQHDSEIQAILSLPNVAAVMPSYDHEEDWMKQVAGDCIWSDPASEELEPHLPASGFGESPRGGGAVCFGSRAIDNFLDANGLSYIIRAHEAHAHGVSIAKSARVFTVFSTSKDHRQGGTAMAGCILVDNYLIQAINRSPKYRNKYVHRRTSLSVAHVPKEELEVRRKLGLVRFSVESAEEARMRKEREAEDARSASSSPSSPSGSGRGASNKENSAARANATFKISF